MTDTQVRTFKTRRSMDSGVGWRPCAGSWQIASSDTRDRVGRALSERCDVNSG